MSTSFGCLDELRTLEHSTLKVPYETLNKQYRNVQKSIDRDCSSLSQSVVSTEKLVKSTDFSKADIINSFSNVIEKLRSLKKHSNDLRNEEKDLLQLVKKRVDHLKENEGSNAIVTKNFKKQRLDRMLIDYFLRSGFYETAQLLANKSNIEVSGTLKFILLCP